MEKINSHNTNLSSVHSHSKNDDNLYNDAKKQISNQKSPQVSVISTNNSTNDNIMSKRKVSATKSDNQISDTKNKNNLSGHP